MSAPNIGPGSGSGSGSAQMAGSVPGSYFPLHAAPGPPPSMMTGESPQRSYAKPYYPSEGGRQGPGHGDNHGPSGQALEPYQHHHDHNQQQQQQQPQQEAQQTSRLPFPPGTRQGGFATTTTPNRTVSASNANTSSSEGSWEGHVKAAGGPGGIIGGGRSVSIAEGQQFITITPSYGDEIHVPVDVHQASKQADEKRLRNAGASARFRARKKEKDREAQIGIQRLEALNRDLQKRNQELEAQRDFYRNERNRLRHIMSQSPSMREYIDSGPPSPASTSLSGPSYGAEGSPMTGSNVQPASAQHLQAPPQQQQPQPQPRLHPQHLPQHQLYTQHPQHPHQPQRQITPTHTPGPLYPPMTTAPEFSGPPPAHLPGASDSAVGVERPSQRRRTDSGPNIEYYTPSYTTSAPPPPILPSSLPPPIAPAASSSFHSMSPSPLSGSPSNPRLPPLRLDTPGSNPSSVGIGGGMGTGPPTPEPTHGSASALPVPQQYPPATTASSTYNRSYDTAGWAADAPASHPQHQPPDSKFQR
ncbi:hypothetical protein HMPREF1624_02774 [Sporothrix schenckii ATCC 58251]|uniref:BZIP domain-containing protein n=2 Tax=Sporothrix schenckii TaxID=29908 RepID=U7Q102_SPOS1|nr:hypothetical protein HMPREF1624_02774 [Sporothrix schenckii ATCC 58251]